MSRNSWKLACRLDHSFAAVDTGKENAVFVRPELVADIEYRAWTHDGNSVEFESGDEAPLLLGSVEVELKIDDARLPAVIAPTGLPVRIEKNGVLNAYVTMAGAERRLAGSIYLNLVSDPYR